MAQTCPACGCADFEKHHYGQSGNENVLHCGACKNWFLFAGGAYVVCDKKGNFVEERRIT